MSDLTTSAGTTKVTKYAVETPKYGMWRAEAVLDHGDVLPSGKVTLTSADLVLVGTVERAAFDEPSKPRAIIYGGIGWLKEITSPISFQSDSGVRLSTVLSTLAGGSGETIVLPGPDTTIGDYYEIVASRLGEPVRYVDALNALVRAGYAPPWRVDPDGVTRFGARPAITITSRATPLPQSEVGALTFGADNPAQFMPGAALAGGAPFARTLIRETHGRLEVDVWLDEPATGPTARESIRRIIADLLADMLRSYVVAAVHADHRMDLVPAPGNSHYPELKNIEQWIVGGALYTPTAGDEVIVLRRDDRTTKPVVVGIKLVDGPFPFVARLADAVTVLLPPMVASGTIAGVGAFTAVLTSVAAQTLGNISGSSTKVGAKT